MDIVSPSVVWVDRRCYRKTAIEYPDSGEQEQEFFQPPDPVSTEECEDPRITVVCVENGFECRLQVAEAFRSRVIGTGGQTRKRLEAETRTQIRVIAQTCWTLEVTDTLEMPANDVPGRYEAGDVRITGSTRGAVSTCANRLVLILDAARRAHPPTHFLSIPLNLNRTFNDFRDKVIKIEHAERKGLDVSIFQLPERLHLTLGMLVLLSDVERHAAQNALRDCVKNLRAARCRLRGLEIMNDDPREVDVLYAKVHDQSGDAVLQKIVNQGLHALQRAGYGAPDQPPVKLHATLINTRYRKLSKSELYVEGAGELRGQEHRGFHTRETFDARKILENLGNFDFGEFVVHRLEISQLHGVNPSTGYYVCSGFADIEK